MIHFVLLYPKCWRLRWNPCYSSRVYFPSHRYFSFVPYLFSEACQKYWEFVKMWKVLCHVHLKAKFWILLTQTMADLQCLPGEILLSKNFLLFKFNKRVGCFNFLDKSYRHIKSAPNVADASLSAKSSQHILGYRQDLLMIVWPDCNSHTRERW